MTNEEFGMYSFWREWFAQPMAEKMKHLRSPGRGGYYPPASESPGFTGKPDPKEYFHWRLSHGHLGGVETRRIFWDCFNTAQNWCTARGLDDVANAINAEDCVLRILHYPASPTGEVGEAHRDFDLLTVSVPGTVPGLEVFDDAKVCSNNRCGWPCDECEDETQGRCELWDVDCWNCDGGRRECVCAWVPQESGIQVGEMLEIYTNHLADHAIRDPLPATTHRVRTPPNTERFKAVFFYLPPMDFELQPGFTAADYLKDALTRAGTINVGVKP